MLGGMKVMLFVWPRSITSIVLSVLLTVVLNNFF